MHLDIYNLSVIIFIVTIILIPYVFSTEIVSKLKIFSDIKPIFSPYFAYIVLLLIAGSILRLKDLTFQSHWMDELISVIRSDPENTFLNIFQESIGSPHPPLHQILLWQWYKVFGYTEYSGRSLSVIFGLLSIIAIYFLGKALYNKETGLFSAVIATTNAYLIKYSQETRSYSLLFLLSTLSYLFFVRYLRNQSKTNYTGYILTTIAVLYTHAFGIFLFASQAAFILIYLLFYEENKKRLLISVTIASLIIFAAYFPLLSFIANNAEKSSFWAPMPSIDFAKYLFYSYIRSGLLAHFFIFLMVIAVSVTTQNKKKRVSTIILFCWIIFTYLLPYLKSVISVPIIVDRYTIITLPAFIILIGAGIASLCDKRLKTVMLTIVVMLSINTLFFKLDYYNSVRKKQFREMSEYIIKNNNELPVYSRASKHYNMQLRLLNSNMRIQPEKNLHTSLLNENTPKEFWLLDVHPTLTKSTLINDYNLTIKDEVLMHKASATLLTLSNINR